MGATNILLYTKKSRGSIGRLFLLFICSGKCFDFFSHGNVFFRDAVAVVGVECEIHHVVELYVRGGILMTVVCVDG